MSADQYLQSILQREKVDTSQYSPVRNVFSTVRPILQEWAGTLLLDLKASGSFAKGTANNSGTDIDINISISESADETLSEIYNSLYNKFKANGYTPRKQNVSINVNVNGYSVDLVPGKRQSSYTTDHSLYKNKQSTWTKTNIDTHINHVVSAGKSDPIRIVKLWRDQKNLSFPSFYLEMVVIKALDGKYGGLADNVWTVFEYLSNDFENARFVDPANTNNIISDDLTATEKTKIKQQTTAALAASDWGNIVV